jgi:branched-chain amino acid transport system substrate-binding protein
MPKLAKYIKDTPRRTVAMIWVNNDFGKATGHDGEGARSPGVSRSPPTSRPIPARSISGPVLSGPAPTRCSSTPMKRNARAARAAEAGYYADHRGDDADRQKVIELAGDAANGAVAHVGLTADAPQPAIKFDQKFQAGTRAITTA